MSPLDASVAAVVEADDDEEEEAAVVVAAAAAPLLALLNALNAALIASSCVLFLQASMPLTSVLHSLISCVSAFFAPIPVREQ